MAATLWNRQSPPPPASSALSETGSLSGAAKYRARCAFMGARRRCGAYARVMLADVAGDTALSAFFDVISANSGNDGGVDAVVEAGLKTEGKGLSM